MRIFYVHQSLNNTGKITNQNDKELEISDVNLVANIFENNKDNIKTIYTSTYNKCKETARIINLSLKLPVVEDMRLNEYGSVYYGDKMETWEECQRRIIKSIKDIVYTHDENDTVICITSGVNITAFICVAYKIKPDNLLPFPTMVSCSPIGFEINKKDFDFIV